MKARAALQTATHHPFYRLATFALLVGMFARGQEVLVPLALAVVIAFALTPAVKRLERTLGRAAAVALVALLGLGAVSAFGFLLERELVDLSGQITKYSDSMRRKVAALRDERGGGLVGLSRTVDKAVAQIDERVSESRDARPVKIVGGDASAWERLEAALTPVLAPLARAGIVLVLVIFLLLQREDLRDRFIRIIGKGNVTVTTRTLDEAGRRISRFLVVQSAINGAFGAVITLGLLGIGVAYAPLWGFTAAILRFVPFVGTFLAMVLPAVLAFVQAPGWWQVLATVALFIGTDAVAAYAVEPLAIGRKTGVSSLAMIVSAIFWTWLWGPAGLVLSTPLTVCLVVMGRQVPKLETLAVLLGDEPPLEPKLMLYQRLLAGDEDEAGEIIERMRRTASREQVLDQVVVPALLIAEREQVGDAQHEFFLRATRTLIEALRDDPARTPAPTRTPTPTSGSAPTPDRRPLILGVPARTAADDLLWEMLGSLCDPAKVRVESATAAALASEVLAQVESKAPDLVCITSVPPGGLAQARYLCRRLRARVPGARVLVLRPESAKEGPGREAADRLVDEGASGVAATLADAVLRVEQLLLLARPDAQAQAVSATKP